MGFQTIAESASGSLQAAWFGLLSFLPSLLGAIIILIVGFVVAGFLRMAVEKGIKLSKFDVLLKKAGVEKPIQNAGYKLNSGKFFGDLVYWFLVVVVLIATADILSLWGVSLFLGNVLSFVPSIVAAVFIMLATVLLANFLRNVVRGSVAGAKLNSSKALSTLAWWATIIFGFAAALMQLGIAVSLINTIVMGVVAMFALAGGIAFGLGGRDAAAKFVDKIVGDIKE
jgi:hypothetical protein